MTESNVSDNLNCAQF